MINAAQKETALQHEADKADQNEHLDSDSGSAEGNSLAMLRAKAVRAGFMLHTLDDGQFLITRWAHATRALPDLRAAAALLRQMGVA